MSTPASARSVAANKKSFSTPSPADARKLTPGVASSSKKRGKDEDENLEVSKGILKVLANQPASTKSEHVVRSRILLNQQDFIKLGFGTLHPSQLFGLVRIVKEGEETLKDELTGIEKSFVCAVSSLASLKSGTCMLSQEGLDEIKSAERIMLSVLDENSLFNEAKVVVLSTTDEWTKATKNYVRHILNQSIVGEGTMVGVFLAGLLRTIKIASIEPSPAARITSNTKILTLIDTRKGEDTSRGGVSSIPFAGLDEEFQTLRGLMNQTFQSDREKSTFKPVRGALLHGPPGTGKTLLAKKVTESFPGCRLFIVDDEDTACDVINEAFAPSTERRVLFMDEMDSMCTSNRAIVSALLTATDARDSRTFLLGCANNPDDLDAALRRPGRLDEEIEIPPPSQAQRFAILKAHLSVFPCGFDLNHIKPICDTLHGFVGADLALVARETAHLCINSNKRLIELDHLKQATRLVHPSSLRDVEVQVPHVKWEDIGGMEHAKQAIRECVELPLKHPEAFTRMGIRPPQGVLLYGPPGCSKTLLAKAVATESEMNFIAVKGPELLSKWVGDSEKAIRATFRRAKQSKPCVVFFDEIDALAGVRDTAGSGGVSHRVTSQLLQELDGIESRSGVIVLCATNRPDLLDPALVRPGRIDRMVYVSPPDAEAREKILQLNLRKIPHDFDESKLDEIQTEGFSGAEVASICKDAALRALERDENVQFITLDDLKEAAGRLVPQITQQVLDFYRDFAERHATGT